MLPRTRNVGIVLLSALIVAFESVSTEGALNTVGLNSYVVSAVPAFVGGGILLAVFGRGSVGYVKGLDAKGWTYMLVLSAFVAGGVFLWFDAIGRIGASKEAILGGGSSEVLFIVLLSAVFLSERLTKWEAVGSVMVLAGVLMVLMREDTLALTLGLGEVEAIVSSLLLAISVVITTALLRSSALGPLSGLELLLSGIMLLALGTGLGHVYWPGWDGFTVLLLLGLLPAMGLLTYNAGLPRVGASLTSVLFALTGIMTVGVQLLVLFVFPDAAIMLPQSLALAVGGGLIAFVGVYMLNRPPS